MHQQHGAAVIAAVASTLKCGFQFSLLVQLSWPTRTGVAITNHLSWKFILFLSLCCRFEAKLSLWLSDFLSFSASQWVGQAQEATCFSNGKEIISCYEIHPRGETRNCEENVHSYQTCQGFEPRIFKRLTNLFKKSALACHVSQIAERWSWKILISSPQVPPVGNQDEFKWYTTTLVFITAGNLRLVISNWKFEACLKGKFSECQDHLMWKPSKKEQSC